MNEVFARRRARRDRTRAGIVVMEAAEKRLLFATLAEVPVLHSLATARAKLFLDFNGAPAISNWLGVSVPATPAYDRDGNNKSFSNAELDNIREVWSRVAEKYSPFNIDVTTEDPGNQTDRRTCVILIGGNSDWLGRDVGGVAPLGGFFNSAPNVGFVFTDGGVGSNKSVAEAATHEAGHLFDLEHHGVFDSEGKLVEEYDIGNSQVAPIMGVAYYSTRGLWARAATSQGPNIIQDDLEILTGFQNGFGYRADDYGNSQFSAQTVTPTNGVINMKGVIERNTDADVFKVLSPGGKLSFTLDVAQYGPMLDASLTLTDPFGTILARSATSSFGEKVEATVTGGTYLITVTSAGGYGDLGQYTLKGTLPNGGIGGADQYLVTGTDTDDNISVNVVENQYRIDVNGTITLVSKTDVKQFNILAGGGNDVVTIGAGVPGVYVLAGEGNDTVYGGDGADTISGSAGNDLVFGGLGDDRLGGGSGRDYLIGGLGRDRMYGDAGNDTLIGGAGVDRMWGGSEHDLLSGESSADKLYGEAGNDTLYGGNGNDLLDGGDDLDFLWGGNDDDVLYARDNFYDGLNGGAGFDKAQLDPLDTKESLEELLA